MAGSQRTDHKRLSRFAAADLQEKSNGRALDAERESDAMADLTTRQLIETILRSLQENSERMAAKYQGVAADQPAREPRATGPAAFEHERAEGERAATWGRPYSSDVLGGRRPAADRTMSDMTTRELLDTILRSLNENWDRMAAKYKGVAPDQPAPGSRARELESVGSVQGEAPTSSTSDRS